MSVENGTTEDMDASLKEVADSTATSITSTSQDAEDEGDAEELAFPGELRMLSEDFYDPQVNAQLLGTPSGIPTDVETPSSHDMLTCGSLKVDSIYGSPLSPNEASEAVPPGSDGLVRHALVIPDNFCSNRKLVGGLNKRDFDLERGTIKPRRASLPVTQTQLLSSLTRVEGPDGKPRWIFNGVLNGWPSLRNFELISLEKKRTLGPLTPPDYMNSIRHTWKGFWDVGKEGLAGTSPAIKDNSKIYRATLRAASWSSIGWSPDSPGFVFWYEAQRPVPRVTYGTRTIQDVGDDRCTMVR